MFGKTIPISALFKDANGLQMEIMCVFSGLRLGSVNKIEMINDTTIRVHMISREKIAKSYKKMSGSYHWFDGLVGSLLIQYCTWERERPNPYWARGMNCNLYSRVCHPRYG